jgi:hypothetical protein
MIENTYVSGKNLSNRETAITGKIRPHRDITYNPSKEDFEKARRMILKSSAKF